MQFSRLLLFLAFISVMQFSAEGQYFSDTLIVSVPLNGDLGSASQPSYSAHVDSLPSYGDSYDGGIQIGDTISDFTIYKPSDGSAINLRDQIQSTNKMTVITSLSNTCGKTFLTHDSVTTFGYEDAQNFVHDGYSNFNLIQVYGPEAHPSSGQCPSNCPIIDDLETLTGTWNAQHVFYEDRINSSQEFCDSLISRGFESEYVNTIYADNSNNALYNELFERPFGLILIDCEGVVLYTVDWLPLADFGLIYELAQNYSGPCYGHYEPICSEESIDSDEDGLCDDFELLYGMDETKPDSDGDGIGDWEENESSTNPLDACDPLVEDTDLDGICDAQESVDGTDPLNICDPLDTDTDEDGLCDAFENNLGTDPLDIDSDDDGVSDFDELEAGTDPLNSDSFPVNILEENSTSLKFFPNPATSQIQFSRPVIDVRIFNSHGQQVLNEQGIMNEVLLHEIAAGFYFLKVTDTSKQTTSFSLVVE